MDPFQLMTLEGGDKSDGGRGRARLETSLAELEAIVQRLEVGELALEDALVAFERGIALVRQLHSTLNRAEQRVEVLTRESSGDLRLSPLSGEKGTS